MHRLGHYGAALIGYTPLGMIVVAVGLTELAVVGGAVSVGMAMGPGWDQKVPFIDHRGITHTGWFALFIGALFGATGAVVASAAGVGTTILVGGFGFVLGTLSVASHIAADALTPMGVAPFPNGERYSLDLVKAANPVANYLLLGLGILTAAAGGAVGLAIDGVI